MTIANVDMAKAWEEEGTAWAENAERYEAAGDRYWRRLLAATPIGEADRVLDIGCGTGRSTRDAARAATSGAALGVDLSPAMLDYARQAAEREGVANARFELADAQVHPFDPGVFHLAISSFGAMFFADPVAAFANVARALRPGGRLAILAWRRLEENEWLMAMREAVALGRDLPVPPPNAPSPFGLADEALARKVLAGAGFEDVSVEPVDEAMHLGADADDAYAFVSNWGVVRGLTADLDDAGRAQALDNVRAALAARETPGGVLAASAAWLITARKP